jgi:hypothetical protein
MKFAIIFAFIMSLIFFLTAPTAEERQQAQDLKYKNGPVILKTNAMCAKYEYYDATYWKCEDKTIEYVEEQICTPQAGRADSCRTELIKVTK